MRRRAARSFDSDEIAVVAANAIDAPELTVLIPASQATPSRHRGRSNREDIANSPAAASRSPFGAIARSCACVYAAAAAAAAATSRDDESLSGVTVAGGERLGVDGGARAMDAELGSRVRVRASSLDGRARVAVRAPASDWFSVRRTTTHRTLARRLLAPASDCLPVHVRTHQKSSAPPSTFDAAASSSSSSCVVTGGTGALGVVFAAAGDRRLGLLEGHLALPGRETRRRRRGDTRRRRDTCRRRGRVHARGYVRVARRDWMAVRISRSSARGSPPRGRGAPRRGGDERVRGRRASCRRVKKTPRRRPFLPHAEPRARARVLLLHRELRGQRGADSVQRRERVLGLRERDDDARRATRGVDAVGARSTPAAAAWSTPPPSARRSRDRGSDSWPVTKAFTRASA